MIDLDELERLAEKPDCNTDELITLADAVRPLIERVRELEEMSDRAIDEAGYLLGCMPTLDCRVCDYHDYCPEPMPGYEPDIETCRAAMRIFCDPKGAQISENAAEEAE